MSSLVVTRAASLRRSTALFARMSTMHDNDPTLLETEKQRNLSKQQHKTSTPHANAPGWNESLASASEASVKADRSDPLSTTELQSQTIKYVKSRYAAPDDQAATAHYSRDEVDGPLKSATGREDVQEVYQTVTKTVRGRSTEVVEDDGPPKGYS